MFALLGPVMWGACNVSCKFRWVIVHLCIYVRTLIVVMCRFHIIITCSNVNRAWCGERAVCVGHAMMCHVSSMLKTKNMSIQFSSPVFQYSSPVQ